MLGERFSAGQDSANSGFGMRPEPPGDATSVLSLPPSPHPRHCLSNVTEWSQRRACPNHDLANLGPKGNCPSCTRSICWIYEQRRSTRGLVALSVAYPRRKTAYYCPHTTYLLPVQLPLLQEVSETNIYTGWPQAPCSPLNH